jgi:hypothetical protein
MLCKLLARTSEDNPVFHPRTLTFSTKTTIHEIMSVTPTQLQVLVYYCKHPPMISDLPRYRASHQSFTNKLSKQVWKFCSNCGTVVFLKIHWKEKWDCESDKLNATVSHICNEYSVQTADLRKSITQSNTCGIVALMIFCMTIPLWTQQKRYKKT